MPLTVPEKQPPPPSYEDLALRWITGSKEERNLVDANAQATVAIAYALLAINDTIKQIAREYIWSKNE